MFLTRNENQIIIKSFSERAEEASLFPNGSLLLQYLLRSPDMVDVTEAVTGNNNVFLYLL